MRKYISLLDPQGTGGNGKPDQADVLAELNGMKASLSGVKLALPDLISQHASLSTEKTALTSELAKVKGDSTKLAAGATLPTDLVSAANEIAQLKAENTQMKGEKVSVEAAVAKEVAKLGLVSKKPDAAGGDAKKPQTLTEKVLALRGVKSLEELNTKMDAERAKTVAAASE